MRDYQYDHVHLRSPDPDATARFFETMFGAEVTRGVYPPGTLYPGQQRVTMRLGGQKVLIAAAPARTERLGAAVSPLRAGAYRVDGRRRRCRGGRAASERRRDRNCSADPQPRTPARFCARAGRYHDRARAAVKLRRKSRGAKGA